MDHMTNNPTLPDFPFTPRWHDTPQGRLHHVDEGQGPPLVFVHGMPTWSYLWRRFIDHFARTHRVIAVDHLGFGRSDKPVDADYHPCTHSLRLSSLIAELGLRDITLVVHDFGGPIGLGHAVRSPDSVARLVLFNTWMWSLADHEGAQRVDRLVCGTMGHVMYRWLNGSTRFLIPKMMAPGHNLGPADHRAYIDAAPTSNDRVGQLAMARSLLGASDWYNELWLNREQIANKSAAIIWGMRDPTFGADELARWRNLLPHAEVTELPETGHFPQEEAPEASIAAIERLLATQVVARSA